MIVKYRPLSEPIRLQDLKDSARSQAWKKNKRFISQLAQILPKERVFCPAALLGTPVRTTEEF